MEGREDKKKEAFTNLISLGIAGIGLVGFSIAGYYLYSRYFKKKALFFPEMKQLIEELEILRGLTDYTPNQWDRKTFILDSFCKDYDWETFKPGNKDHWDIFHPFLIEMVNLQLVRGDVEKVVFFCKFYLENVKLFENRKTLSESERGFIIGYTAILWRFLGSRKMNQNKTEDLKKLQEALWEVYADEIPTFPVEVRQMLEPMMRKHYLSCLMKREEHEKVAQLFIQVLSDKKAIQSNLIGVEGVSILFMGWNAFLRQKNQQIGTQEMKEMKQIVKDCCHSLDLLGFYFSVGEFDIYVDGLMDYFDQEGAYSVLRFCFTKESQLIDFKLKILDFETDKLIYEEDFFKNDIPEPLKNKLFITEAEREKLEEGTYETFAKTLLSETQKFTSQTNSEQLVFVSNLQEFSYSVRTISTKKLHLQSNKHFIFLFEVSGKEVARFSLISTSNTTQTQTIKTLKEIGWLPKQPTHFAFYSIDHLCARFGVNLFFVDPTAVKKFVEEVGFTNICFYFENEFALTILDFLIIHCLIPANLFAEKLEPLKTLFQNFDNQLNYFLNQSDRLNINPSKFYLFQFTIWTTAISTFEKLNDFEEANKYATKILSSPVNQTIDASNGEAIMNALSFQAKDRFSKDLKGSLSQFYSKLENMCDKTFEKTLQAPETEDLKLLLFCIKERFQIRLSEKFIKEGNFEKLTKMLRADFSTVPPSQLKRHCLNDLLSNVLKFQILWKEKFSKQPLQIEPQIKEHLLQLESNISDLIPHKIRLFVLSEIVPQIMLCVNLRYSLGDKKETFELLEKCKKIMENHNLRFSSCEPTTFCLYSSFLIRKPENSEFADLNLIFIPNFKVYSYKDFYVNENDLCQCFIVPFSQISLLENGNEQLEQLSEKDESISFFSFKYEKKNFSKTKNALERSIRLTKTIKLKKKERYYVAKFVEIESSTKREICSTFFIFGVSEIDPSPLFQIMSEYDPSSFWNQAKQQFFI